MRPDPSKYYILVRQGREEDEPDDLMGALSELVTSDDDPKDLFRPYQNTFQLIHANILAFRGVSNHVVGIIPFIPWLRCAQARYMATQPHYHYFRALSVGEDLREDPADVLSHLLGAQEFRDLVVGLRLLLADRNDKTSEYTNHFLDPVGSDMHIRYLVERIREHPALALYNDPSILADLRRAEKHLGRAVEEEEETP